MTLQADTTPSDVQAEPAPKRGPVTLLREGEVDYQSRGGVVVVEPRSVEQAVADADGGVIADSTDVFGGVALTLVWLVTIGAVGGFALLVWRVIDARRTPSERAFGGLCRHWGIAKRDRAALRRLAEIAQVEPVAVVVNRDALRATLARAHAKRGAASEPLLVEAERVASGVR